MELLEFNLLKIEVIEEYFPEDIINNVVVLKKYNWKCGFNFKIKKISKENQGVNIDISYKMHPIDKPEDKIFFLKTRSSFAIKGKLSSEAKLNLLYHLIAISIWNHQGIFAAKTEGTIYETELPPEANFNQFEEKFKIQIANEWK
jgi:hypothetical protein